MDITSIPNDDSHKWADITPLGSAAIILEGTNSVKGGYDEYPSIFISPDYTLTIKGSDLLTASSNSWRLGIGSSTGTNASCGTVTIGGTVYWDGSSYQNGGDTYLTQSPFTYTPSN